jgi:hypothetical protein
MENLNTAFDVAEKYLDIPRMLDPEGELIAFSSFVFDCNQKSLFYRQIIL